MIIPSTSSCNWWCSWGYLFKGIYMWYTHDEITSISWDISPLTMVKRIQLVHWNLPSKRVHFGAPNFPFTTSDFLGWWYGKCHRSKAFSHYTLDMYTVCYIYPWHGCAGTCGYLIWKMKKKRWSLGYPIFRNPNSYSNLATVKLQIPCGKQLKALPAAESWGFAHTGVYIKIWRFP